jgi:hypothetical protein
MAGLCRPLGVRIFTLTVAAGAAQTRILRRVRETPGYDGYSRPSNFGEDVIRTIRARRAPRSYRF